MNKSQLIDTLSARFEGNRKQAAHALESVLDTITREVAKGEKVAITGFGSFEKRVREARWVRNPQTGARMKAKKTSVPKFTAGQDLKNVVSGAKKLPKVAVAAGGSAAKKAAAPAKKAAAAARSTAKKSTAKKSAPAKKAAPAKKTAAKKTTATKSAAKKSAPAKKPRPRSRPRPRRPRPRSRHPRRRPRPRSGHGQEDCGQEGTGQEGAGQEVSGEEDRQEVLIDPRDRGRPRGRPLSLCSGEQRHGVAGEGARTEPQCLGQRRLVVDVATQRRQVAHDFARTRGGVGGA